MERSTRPVAIWLREYGCLAATRQHLRKVPNWQVNRGRCALQRKSRRHMPGAAARQAPPAHWKFRTAASSAEPCLLIFTARCNGIAVTTSRWGVGYVFISPHLNSSPGAGHKGCSRHCS